MTYSEASGLAISDLATIEVKLYLGVHREEGASSLNSYHLNMAIYVQKPTLVGSVLRVRKVNSFVSISYYVALAVGPDVGFHSNRPRWVQGYIMHGH